MGHLTNYFIIIQYTTICSQECVHRSLELVRCCFTGGILLRCPCTTINITFSLCYWIKGNHFTYGSYLTYCTGRFYSLSYWFFEGLSDVAYTIGGIKIVSGEKKKIIAVGIKLVKNFLRLFLVAVSKGSY